MFLHVLSQSKISKEIITYAGIALCNSEWSGDMVVKDNKPKGTDFFMKKILRTITVSVKILNGQC